MPLAITDEQQQLAVAIGQFAERHAPVAKTRTMFESIASGELPPWWQEFVDLGFHAVHLPAEVGGQGGTVMDMACVVEAAATALLPGPLLSTATASAIVATAVAAEGDSASGSALLKELAAGATAAVVLPEHSDFRASTDLAGWRLSGSSGLTLGICSAQRVIVPARTDGDHVQWFVVNTEDSDLKAVAHEGTDLCVDVGVLDLIDHRVSPDSELRGVDGERARCLVATLAACATSGTVRWCLDAAVAYLRTREQFGKPIGTFQALQHKAATLLVNVELAEAAAWDAVRAADESIEQHRLAAAAAALMAVAPGPDLALDALLMFGAIGYTWEHDLHLYWRRATSLAASVGPATRWSREAGELARTVQRSTALNFGDVESEFRAEVAALLDRALTVRDVRSTRDDELPGFEIGPRRDLLAAAGLVAPQLKAPWGLSASALQQVIINEEFAKRPELIRPTLSIAEWIVPTIVESGSDLQREQLIWPTLRGIRQWCQLYSEPGAGSDLASLTTRATEVEGGWLVNGRKIWTSFAHLAHFGAMLARTEPDAPKHQGLSYFIVDMATEGVDVSTIKQSSGHHEFSEVVFTDVFVPDDMMIGQRGDGWNIAVGAMAVERTAIGGYVSIDRVGTLRSLAAVDGPDQDAVLRILGDLEVYTNALRALVTRETLRQVDGQGPGPTSSIAKVAMSTLLRRAASTTLNNDRSAMICDPDSARRRGYFDMPAELIGGGTGEIQLTVIAQMILGLPRK